MTSALPVMERVDFSPVKSIVVGSGEELPVLGQGPVRLQTQAGDQVILSQVQYAPGLRVNLISVRQLDSKGCKTTFGDGRVQVQAPTGDVILTGTLRTTPGISDLLYLLDGEPLTSTGALGEHL